MMWSSFKVPVRTGRVYILGELPKDKFVSAVSDIMTLHWDQAGTAQEVLRNAMCSAARSELGQAGRREADWFRGNESVLKPLFEKRSQLFPVAVLREGEAQEEVGRGKERCKESCKRSEEQVVPRFSQESTPSCSSGCPGCSSTLPPHHSFWYV